MLIIGPAWGGTDAVLAVSAGPSDGHTHGLPAQLALRLHLLSTLNIPSNSAPLHVADHSQEPGGQSTDSSEPVHP